MDNICNIETEKKILIITNLKPETYSNFYNVAVKVLKFATLYLWQWYVTLSGYVHAAGGVMHSRIKAAISFHSPAIK